MLLAPRIVQGVGGAARVGARNDDAETVPARAQVELRLERRAVAAVEMSVVEGEEDRVVGGAHDAARPDGVAAAAILEPGEARPEHPAVRRLQIEKRRSGPNQFQVVDDDAVPDRVHGIEGSERLRPRRWLGGPGGLGRDDDAALGVMEQALAVSGGRRERGQQRERGQSAKPCTDRFHER